MSKEVKELKAQLDNLAKIVYLLRKQQTARRRNNSDFRIPINTVLIGFTRRNKYPFVLTVQGKNKFVVGKNTYKSLSAAAEDVSGVRRSGWTFWRTLDGKTAKEAF